MPLPLSDYASLIEPAWLAIIFLVPFYPLSPWERVRVRGARMLGFAGSAPTYRLCRLWLSVSRMLGFAGSAPTYKLRRLWLSVAKPNVYREISFSFPSSPTLLLLF